MARGAAQLQVKVKLAWWLRWYLVGVVLMCRMTGCHADEDKLRYWIRRAMIIRVE